MDLGFLLGKSRLAPKYVHTVAHLELCDVVVAYEVATIVVDNLDHKSDRIQFYSDSCMVLGYLYTT